MGDNNDGQNLYLEHLSIKIDAAKAELFGGSSTDDFNGPYTNSQISIPVSWARNLFQYQLGSVSGNGSSGQNVKFRMFHLNSESGDITGDTLKWFNTKNVIPGEAIVDAGSRIPIYGSTTLSGDDAKINGDFIRYVAAQLFGVPVSDLFVNEKSVRTDLVRKSAYQFNDNIQQLVDFKINYGTAASPEMDYVRTTTDSQTSPNETPERIAMATSFPTKLIYEQLFSAVPERFSDLDLFDNKSTHHLYTEDNIATTNDALGVFLWRHCPLKKNDKIFFLFTVTPNSSQETIATPDQGDGTDVPARVYRIQCNIVDDTDTKITGESSTSGSYSRGWTPEGWNSGTSLTTPGPTFQTLPYLN